MTHSKSFTCIFIFFLLNSFCSGAQTVKVDSTFSINPAFNKLMYGHLQQPDGKIVFWGLIHTGSGSLANYIARVDTAGATDLGFWNDTIKNGPIYCAALQPTGKLIVGGAFNTQWLTGPRDFVARLNPNGAFDPSYSAIGGLNNFVFCLALTPQGETYAAGFFSQYSTSPSARIIRLLANGTVDPSFVVGTGFDNDVWTLALQPDSKLLVGGRFTNYNNSTCQKITRLLPTGAIDNTFTVGTGFSGPSAYVSKLILQPDGKILVAGTFTAYNGTPATNIVRLLPNGAFDPTFNTGNGFDGPLYEIALQADGKILTSGTFSNCNGSPAPRICRLLAGGAVDSAFKAGVGFKNNVNITLQPDGKIICSGRDTLFDGKPINTVVRLFVTPSVSVNTTGTKKEKEVSFRVWPNPTTDFVYITSNVNSTSTSFELVSIDGKVIFPTFTKTGNTYFVNISALENGLYMLLLKENGQVLSASKIQKQTIN